MSVESSLATNRSAAPAALTEAGTGPISPAMYVAAYITTMCGVLGVAITLEDPAYTNLAMGLCTIGFVVSFISRRQSIATSVIELPAAVLFFGVCVFALLSEQGIQMLAPPSVGEDRSKALAVFLTWLVVFRSFTLTSEGRLIFCAVPTLALLGLSATVNTDPTLGTLFLVYVLSTTFMLIHETHLAQEAKRRQAGLGVSPSILSRHAQITILCVAGAAILGGMLASWLNTIGSALVTTGLVAPPAQRTTAAPQTPILYAAERELRVGTGPVQLSDQVVMRVRADHGAYWRSATFDTYTGDGWRNSLTADILLDKRLVEAREADPFAPTTSANRVVEVEVRRTAINQVGSGHRLKQTVRLEGLGQFAEIHGASEPAVVRIGGLTTGQLERLTLRMDLAATIHLPDPIQGAEYEVISDVPDWTPESLRLAGERYPREISTRYLQVSSVERDALERLRQHALGIVEGKATPYDRAMALRDWIASNCAYNTAAEGTPAGRDVSAYFILNQREGYCDSFATSLAVMCRLVGIPARVATGFTEGELDRNAQWYVIRDRDRHLWTEVFFPGTGWVAMDATEGSTDISPREEAVKRGRGIFYFLFRRGWLPPTALLAFIVLLGYVIKVELLDRLRRNREEIRTWQLPASNMHIAGAYGQACAALARRGLRRAATSTISEFRDEVRGALAEVEGLDAAFSELSDLAEKYCYSREEAGAKDVRAADSSLARIARLAARLPRRKAPQAQPQGA